MKFLHYGKLTLIVPKDGVAYVDDQNGDEFALSVRFKENALGLPYEGMPIEFNCNAQGTITSYLISHPLFGSHLKNTYGP